jgi:phosphatidylserine/phosphatidylglycerophosphate/cardiolipin synthase-like enzyme
MQAELLQEEWSEALSALFRGASKNVLIASPFVTRRGINLLVENLSESVRDGGNVQVLVNLSPQNIIQGSVDPASLRHFFNAISAPSLYHLPRLHAKVYVADTAEAIATSGNLTAGGLDHNFECGICTSDKTAIAVLRNDLEEYAELGARISEEELDSYSQAAEKVRDTFRRQQQSTQEAARKSFERAFEEANKELIRFRLKGRSTNDTFARTILYLLRKKGPMATEELHPHIQRIHPDLCDDSVDRVIEGQNYGKRWKHRVRAAQSSLKQKGDIKLSEGKWRLKSD